MSTETFADLRELARRHHVLRVALGAPCAFAIADGTGTGLPFLAPLFYVILAVSMKMPLPAKPAVLFLGVLLVVPAVFATISTLFAEYSYLLVAFIVLILFMAFRMQLKPQTAAIGSLLVIFVLVLPMLTSESALVAGVFPAVLSVNAAIGLLTLYPAFAVFPRPAELPPDPPVVAASNLTDAERTRLAATSAVVMLPLVAIFLAYDLTSAIRSLIVCSTVLIGLDRTQQLRRGGLAVATVVVAGGGALLAALWYSWWPALFPLLLVLALIGLALAPHAVQGPSAPIFAGGLSALWTLIGASSDDPLSQTLFWMMLAVAGAAYAVGAQSLLNWFTESRMPVHARRAEIASE